jgi:Zn-dependent protease with chaperone function
MMPARHRRKVGAAALVLALAAGLGSTPASAQLSRFLPNRAGGIDGSRGAYIDQVDVAQIQTAVSTDRAFAFAGEGGNSGRHRAMRLPMTETLSSLDEMIRRLDTSWGERPRTGEVNVYVVADIHYHAEALPDGSIMVSLGLIQSAESDADIAFVLGHELAHVRLGHFADDRAFRERRQQINQLAQGYWQVVSLSQTRLRERGDSIELYDSDERNTRSAAGQAVAANDMLETALDLFVAPAWSRNQEDQADALGADLIQLAGLDGAGGSQTAIRKNAADFDLRQNAISSYREQIAETTALFSSDGIQRQLQAGQFGEVGDAILTNVVQGGLRRGAQLLSGFFRQEHRTPEARIEGLSRYFDAVPMYQDYVGMEIENTWLTQVRATPEWREGVATTEALQAANAQRLAGDLQAAIEALQPALSGRFKSTPVVANASARIYGDAGMIDEADRLYWTAHQDLDQALFAYIDHAELMAGARRYDDARRVIHAGGQHYLRELPAEAAPLPGAEEQPFLPILVDMAFAERDEAKQTQYLQRCMNSGEPDLRQQCIINAFAPGNFDELPPERQAQIADLAAQAGRTQAVAPGLSGVVGGLGRLLGGN